MIRKSLIAKIKNLFPKLPSLNFNDQQSSSVNQTESERHQEEDKLITEIYLNVDTPEAKNDVDPKISQIPKQIVHKIEAKRHRGDHQISQEIKPVDGIKIFSNL